MTPGEIKPQETLAPDAAPAAEDYVSIHHNTTNRWLGITARFIAATLLFLLVRSSFDSFLADSGEQTQSLSKALNYLLMVLCLSFAHCMFVQRVTILAIASLGPLISFVFPKLVILHATPELIETLNPKAMEAANSLAESWLFITIFYCIAFALLDFASPVKVDQVRLKQFLIPKYYWFSFLVLSTLTVFVALPMFGAIRTATTIAIICCQPKGMRNMTLPAVLYLTFLNAIDFIESGQLALAITCSFLVLITGVVNKKIHIAAVGMVGIIIFSYLQAFKYEYRDILRTNPEMTFFDKLELTRIGILMTVVTTLSDSDDEDATPSNTPTSIPLRLLSANLTSNNFIRRVHDESFERVLQLTPEVVPYWNGETLEMALFAVIPRFLWPHKPSLVFGPAFGHKYGYLEEDDNETSITCNFFAEGHMNYGAAGVFLVTVVIAFLLIFAEVLSRQILKSQIAIGVLAYGFVFLSFGSFLTSIVSNFIYASLILVIFRLVLLKRLFSSMTENEAPHEQPESTEKVAA